MSAYSYALSTCKLARRRPRGRDYVRDHCVDALGVCSAQHFCHLNREPVEGEHSGPEGVREVVVEVGYRV